MTFPQRAIGAARLSVPSFEEIEADRSATGQALIVVVLSSLAAGIGLSSGLYNAPVLHRVVLALLLWVFWAISTYIVGVYLMPEPQTQTDVGELLRTIGFAASPGMLRILGMLPVFGGTIYVITDGKKRGITSATAFQNMGYDWGRVVTIQSDVFHNIGEVGPPIDDSTTYQCQSYCR